MKAEEFKKIIREEVKAAIRAEVRDIILEAVEIASRPEQPKVQKPVQEQRKAVPGQVTLDMNPIVGILEDTAKSMTRQDYKNIYESSQAVGISQPVIEEEVEALPSFVTNAKAIFEASNEIDRRKHGV